MSKSLMGEQLSTETTEGRAVETVPVWSDGQLAPLDPNVVRETASLLELALQLQHSFITKQLRTPSQQSSHSKGSKSRLGLPEGFISRLGRYGRAVLLADNIYRLPNGLEFIPQPPTGTLGSKSHQYALLTEAQFRRCQRGSVYVRTDGRIFDYAFDHGDTEREMFDTGFTLGDLERTGRYAPKLKRRSNSRKKLKVKKKGRK